jgi:Holliday junction resolvasome RuvABC endonuclease subunit|tara:strand:+ start:301 stop:873 length:573 start_codon:yes stop_codon:yes gene_type:complete
MKTLTNFKFIAGVDYSLTSPAVCISEIINSNIEFKNCKFHYLKQNKSQETFDNFFAYDYPEYSDDIERFTKLANWVIECIRWYDGRVEYIYLEDYAFAATGRVFNIGENTGILKQHLRTNGFRYTTIPPTVIKKHATGKGNANKELMYETFLTETNVDLKSKLTPKSTKIANPVSDIVDSYYICKTGFQL